MLRICIDIRSLLEKTWSGVPQYTDHLVKNILQIDHVNQYYLFYNSYSSKVKLPSLHGANVTIVDCHYPNKLLNASIFFLKQPSIEQLICNRIGVKMDVIFYPNINFGAVNKRIDGAKNIITVHDLSFEIDPSFYSIKNRLWHKFVNPKKICNSADKIIAVSDNTKRDLMRVYGINENKIKVIHSGLNDINRVKSMECATFKIHPVIRLGAKSDDLANYILYLGTIEKRKNINNLIRAFHTFCTGRKDSNIKLLLAGNIGYGGRSVVSLIRTLKLEEDVILFGAVTEEVKYELYKNASLFIFPSCYEGFGMPVLDAMQFGVPIITSCGSSLGEICGDAALLVDPDDVATMAWTITQTIDDHELRNQLLSNAKKRLAQFSWEKTAKEVIKLFNE